MELLGPFVHTLLWGVLPLLLYTAFRRYLQAMNIVRPITFAVVSANLLNFAGNWLFMYGNWGAPRLGLEGSGYLDFALARVYRARTADCGAAPRAQARQSPSAGKLAPAVAADPPPARAGLSLRHADSRRRRRLRRRDGDGRPVRRSLAGRAQHRRQRHLDHLHGPARHQFRRRRAGRTGRRAQICVRHRGLGLDRVAARRRIHGVRRSGARLRSPLDRAPVHTGGRGDRRQAPRCCASRRCSRSSTVIQVVATGALRGLGDTRTPALAHLAGYWIIGLPVAYLLCFSYGWGVTGIWVGLTGALIAVGVILLLVWHREMKAAQS